jgi:hypothetical protein
MKASAVVVLAAMACQSAADRNDAANEMSGPSPTEATATAGPGPVPDMAAPTEATGAPALPVPGGPGGQIIPGDPDAENAPASTAAPPECAGVAEQATEALLPVDVIVVIDNSSSMSEEIIEVQNRINGDFAEIMQASGLDYRVIMIARYGDVNIEVGQSDHPICIGPPLGATPCTTPDTEPLSNNDPLYFHYSSDVGSREPWCDILAGYASPDEHGSTPNDRATAWTPLLPNGFSEVLRENAFKHFLVITDDNSQCNVTVAAGATATGDPVPGGTFAFNDQDQIDPGLTAAEDFDAALLASAPNQFGTAEDRRYRWHSIVGMVGKEAAAGAVPEPWYPDEPVTEETCGAMLSEGAGTGFQQLSVLTGGLRYPSCFTENFDAVFNAIAEGIVEGAMLSCEWEIPPPPDDETFDSELVNVEFIPGGGTPMVVQKAASLADCGDAPGWYFDDEANPTRILACPASCAEFQADMSGEIHIVFGCKTVTKGVF